MDDNLQRDLWGRYASAGMEFFIAIILPTGGGVWLDCRTGTLPLWTLVGLAVGFAAGLYRLVQIAGELKRGNKPPSTQEGENED